ncbi:MAG TPA: hypothetical protein VE173_03415, partial [Longimicrobiales bacterium]|nr:hypothetical protein [Longimicrobiales bacterium]
PPALDASDVTSLVWQHNWILEGPLGDSVGIHEGFLPRQEIDQKIRLAGSQLREQGLALSFGPDRSFASPRWASVTTVINPTGADLTRTEFLEFYAAGGEPLTLVLDLGTVSEDAMFVGPAGATSGTKENGVAWGLGLLDQEADPALGQVWGHEADERGVWGEACVADPGRIYRIGDPRAVCTRGNGRNDSEDTDGDGNLDETEKYLRYVVRLDGSSPFLARTRDETGTQFQLYRIPLEAPAAVEVGGPFTEADLRAVRHLRITVAGSRPGAVTLARMRLLGSRWVKRAQEGVVRGIVGDSAALQGRVEVTPVSRLTEGQAYESPPGVLEELADPTSAFGAQGVEFNEKSLALRFEDVQPGERAEVYNRFPQRPRDFLTYREARMWVVARSGDFGDQKPTYFFFKVGTDPENFYLFRTRLPAPPGGGGVTPSDWLPEVVVDFGRWLDLRRRAEELVVVDHQEPGQPPVTVWSRDSTYAVVLKDRGRAPNLANVREMSMGVWNEGQAPVEGEVWVDELRLSAGLRDPGLAGYLDARLQGADILETGVTLSGRGAFFHQLDEDPSYQADRLLSWRSRVRLGRFAPASWGIELPVTVLYERADQQPTFLRQSDVLAERLPRLRDTGTRQTRVSLGFRKSTPSADPVLSALLDGLSANMAWYSTSASTVTSTREAEGIDARVGYTRLLDRR